MDFLTLRPSICETRESVIIRTGFFTCLLTLFLNMRKVEIIPLRKILLITYRRAYFFKSQSIINFRNVLYVDYTFDSIGTGWGLTSFGFGRQDQIESFSIAIVTQKDKRYPICTYRGEGSKCTGWTGVLLGGDDIIDFSGTQEDESRKLAEYLAKLIGVTIGKPMGSTIKMAKCPKCGRPASLYKKKCLYCGAIVN